MEADPIAASNNIFEVRDAFGKILSSSLYNTLSPHKMTLSAMDDVLTQIGC
jgi:hypothetical protein